MSPTPCPATTPSPDELSDTGAPSGLLLGVVGAVSDLHTKGRGPCFCRVCMLEWRKGVGL
jgi:hypothetical protein